MIPWEVLIFPSNVESETSGVWQDLDSHKYMRFIEACRNDLPIIWSKEVTMFLFDIDNWKEPIQQN